MEKCSKGKALVPCLKRAGTLTMSNVRFTLMATDKVKFKSIHQNWMTRYKSLQLNLGMEMRSGFTNPIYWVYPMHRKFGITTKVNVQQNNQ